MADLLSTLSAGYRSAGLTIPSSTKYVNVDPAKFEGTWSGSYASQQKFSVSVSNVQGFRAQVKYQAGSTVKYQNVLIKDDAFRVGDSKFILVRSGVAQVKTVMTDAATGASTLETAYVQRG
ncbi:MAG: hypothetical protein IT538_00525 [Variibacter sp.]|nr:hypothetical protein [Variibacter sp.]